MSTGSGAFDLGFFILSPDSPGGKFDVLCRAGSLGFFWPGGTMILVTYILIIFRIEPLSFRYRPVVLDVEYFSMLVESWR